MTPRAFSPVLRRARAVTLIELLIALLIGLVFLGGVAGTYITMSRAAAASEARTRAHTRARVALEAVGEDLNRLIREATDAQVFRIESNDLAYGDNIDNDGDGAIDEEVLDGLDDDGDWDPGDDNHVAIGTCFERPFYVNIPDLGDDAVDEDNLFSNDVLTFRLPESAASPAGPFVTVTYRVGTFDGIDNVLLREQSSVPPLPSDPQVSPVAFDVLSFDVLGYNANNDATPPGYAVGERPYWSETWDSELISAATHQPVDVNNTGLAPFFPPFELPAVLYLSVTVNAEPVDLADNGGWPPAVPGSGEAIKTVTLSTTVYLLDKYDLAIIPPAGTDEVLYDFFARPLGLCN